MTKKFVVACHVSTIPKSPPKIIKNTYTGSEMGQFFYSPQIKAVPLPIEIY